MATIGSRQSLETITTNYLREIFLRERVKSQLLTDWERNFIKSLKTSFVKVGNTSFLSEKQIEVLKKIEEKLWRD